MEAKTLSAYTISIDDLFGMASDVVQQERHNPVIPTNFTPEQLAAMNVDDSPKKKKKKEKTPEQIARKEARKAEKEKMRSIKAARQAEENRLKAEARREKQKKEAEVEVIQLIARKNFLTNKLEDFDPGKEKDAKKIAAINIELREIDERTNYLQQKYNIYIDSVDEGSRIGRFFRKIKEKGKRVIKKIKKFFRDDDNKKLIIGIAGIVLPVIGSFIARLFLKQ